MSQRILSSSGTNLPGGRGQASPEPPGVEAEAGWGLRGEERARREAGPGPAGLRAAWPSGCKCCSRFSYQRGNMEDRRIYYSIPRATRVA